MLCWRGKPQGSKQELGVGLLVHKRLEKNIVEFPRVSEKATLITIKMNIMYNLKIARLCLNLQP